MRLPALPAIDVKTKSKGIRVSAAVLDACRLDGEALLLSLQSRASGLTQAEAEQRAHTSGPNEVAKEKQQSWLIRLLLIIRNPLVILLVVLASISFFTGDLRAGTVMAAMVVLSVTLRSYQEARADSAAAKLKAMIHVTATVVRDGSARELPLRDLVPGDIVNLSAGDMIPGDVRVLTANDLFVSQGSMTGESAPVEKFQAAEAKPVASPAELNNTCFMGTSVQSGTATVVIVTTGDQTYLGTMASAITEDEPPTSFDQGLDRFTWLMIRLMAVMAPTVGAHAGDELGMTEAFSAYPVQAALASVGRFAVWATVPLLITVFAPESTLQLFISGTLLLFLITLGVLAGGVGAIFVI